MCFHYFIEEFSGIWEISQSHHPFATCLPPVCHSISTQLPPFCHPFATQFPPNYHPFATQFPPVCHQFTTKFPPFCHSISTQLPPFCHPISKRLKANFEKKHKFIIEWFPLTLIFFFLFTLSPVAARPGYYFCFLLSLYQY